MLEKDPSAVYDSVGEMAYFFVINPHSFKKPKLQQAVITKIESCFGSGQKYEIYISQYPRDAVTAVHNYLKEAPADETVRIYAVGGDGILFDCLNGMVSFPNAELTSIPYGSANDAVRGFFGEDAGERFRDIKSLIAAPSRAVDIIRCGPNYLLNAIGIGVPGHSVRYSNSLFRGKYQKIFNKIAGPVYFFSALATMTNKEIMRQQYRIFMDGEERFSGGYSSMRIGNGPCNGSDMVIGPYAKPYDGQLDLVLAEECSGMTLLKTLRDYTIGHFEKHAMYFGAKCKTLLLQSDIPIHVHLDGEFFTFKELDIEILPGRIRFIAPADIPFADFSGHAYGGRT